MAKDDQLRLLLTRPEKEWVRTQADAAGVDMTEWARRRLGLSPSDGDLAKLDPLSAAPRVAIVTMGDETWVTMVFDDERDHLAALKVLKRMVRDD